MTIDNRDQMFRLAFDAWKAQVDGYWTRSSYFVVFELAFAAGIWKIFEGRHWWTSLGMSVGAIVMTTSWFLNNARTREYIHYYWYALQRLERELQLPGELLVFSRLERDRPQKSYPGDYRHYVQVIPFVFLGAWFWMGTWSALLLGRVVHI